ncbi:hypothetical protein GCM10010172_74900 [Paractinoplanes ferrugineus]|uniref:Uncharacterized protein n=1 Tax=Paractinoplanes ferrugineus TaxID=113564 RepID=A0A919MG85_9ACTN|nr:hypothetical protein Afe05nite_31950 [Actinoplanes ferrugineus]
MRTLRLYPRLLGAHVRSMLEYEADFAILAAATVLMRVVNVVFLAALFAKVPHLNGWTFWSVVLMFGIVALAEGVGSLFFDGMASFWLASPSPMFAFALHQVGDLARFPLSIYPIAPQGGAGPGPAVRVHQLLPDRLPAGHRAVPSAGTADPAGGGVLRGHGNLDLPAWPASLRERRQLRAGYARNRMETSPLNDRLPVHRLLDLRRVRYAF